jgi:hypothetical protein
MINFGIVVPICDYPDEIFRGAGPVSSGRSLAGARSSLAGDRLYLC